MCAICASCSDLLIGLFFFGLDDGAEAGATLFIAGSGESFGIGACFLTKL
jgi:hypothetical protein